MKSTIDYRDYKINHDYESSALKRDWVYSHKDYDGAPDSDDYRCGRATSIEIACEEIDEQIDNEGIV